MSLIVEKGVKVLNEIMGVCWFVFNFQNTNKEYEMM
jgi:hypothetical protein